MSLRDLVGVSGVRIAEPAAGFAMHLLTTRPGHAVRRCRTAELTAALSATVVRQARAATVRPASLFPAGCADGPRHQYPLGQRRFRGNRSAGRGGSRSSARVSTRRQPQRGALAQPAECVGPYSYDSTHRASTIRRSTASGIDRLPASQRLHADSVTPYQLAAWAMVQPFDRRNRRSCRGQWDARGIPRRGVGPGLDAGGGVMPLFYYRDLPLASYGSRSG